MVLGFYVTLKWPLVLIVSASSLFFTPSSPHPGDLSIPFHLPSSIHLIHSMSSCTGTYTPYTHSTYNRYYLRPLWGNKLAFFLPQTKSYLGQSGNRDSISQEGSGKNIGLETPQPFLDIKSQPCSTFCEFLWTLAFAYIESYACEAHRDRYLYLHVHASLWLTLLCYYVYSFSQPVPPSHWTCSLGGCACGQSPGAASTCLHGSCRSLLVNFHTLASLFLLKVFLFLGRGRKHECLFLCLLLFFAEKKYGMTHVYYFLICGQCFSCLYELISTPQAVLEFSFVFYFTYDCIVQYPRFRNQLIIFKSIDSCLGKLWSQ